eukprot:76087-Rhodomonas_salina.6
MGADFKNCETSRDVPAKNFVLVPPCPIVLRNRDAKSQTEVLTRAVLLTGSAQAEQSRPTAAQR